MNRRKIEWSELPPELLSIIAVRLKLRSDVINFRSVCQSWRNSAPFSLFPDKLPILSPILPHNFKIDDYLNQMEGISRSITRRPLNLVAISVILVQSIDNPSLPPWLISVEESNPGKLQLWKSLCRIAEKLPDNFPKNLSLSRFRVSEITRLYALKYTVHASERYMIKLFSLKFRKVVLYVESDTECESESSVISPRVEDCALMVLYGFDGSLLARISLKDGKLSNRTCKSVKKFDDVVCFKGRICVIDRKGRLYWEEKGKLVSSMAVSEPVGEGLGGNRKKRLAVDSSCGELYLVYRSPRYISVAFRVYKLNEGKKKWEELKGIGDDRILVATQDGCFFVTTKDIPTWGGNCLVFSRGVFSAYNNVKRADSEIFKTPVGITLDVAVFHFGSGECKPISYDFAQVLWPPPAWLSSDSRLSEWGSQKDGEAGKKSLVQNCPEMSSIIETFCTRSDTQAKERLSSTDIKENLSVEGSTPDISRYDNAATRCDDVIPKSPESGV